jgi:hypothetical protein
MPFPCFLKPNFGCTPAAATVWFPLVGGPLLEWRGLIRCGLGGSSVEDRWPAQAHALAHATCLWLDWATIQFRFLRPSSFNTALQLVLRPHFLVHFV